MLIITGHIKTTPDQVHDLAAALRSLIPATLREDGCLNYSFALDDAAAGTVLVYERWRDQAALSAHLAQPMIAEIMGGWFDKVSIEVLKFDATNPRGPMD